MHVKWYLLVVLICISIMTSGVGASFHVLFGYLYISGELCFQFIFLFFISNCLGFWLYYRSSLYWVSIPYQINMICKCFSIGCLFILLIVSFDAQKFFILIKANLPIFSSCFSSCF